MTIDLGDKIPIIDAHHHFWKPGVLYPGLVVTDDSDRFTGDTSAIDTTYLPANLRADFEGWNLIGTVCVEAMATDAALEAQWFRDLQDEAGLPTVVVAGADLRDASAPALLERLAGNPAVRGVRQILNWHPDSRYSYVQDPAIMRGETWLENFAALSQHGLSFDLQVYPGQLLESAALARRFPSTRFVLNHCGMPLGTDDLQVREWRDGIADLASCENVTTKISGVGMTLHPWSPDIARPFVEFCIEQFGANRTMFGSNFPVDKPYYSVDSLYQSYLDVACQMSPSERRAIFAETAIDVYRLPIVEENF